MEEGKSEDMDELNDRDGVLTLISKNICRPHRGKNMSINSINHH